MKKCYLILIMILTITIVMSTKHSTAQSGKEATLTIKHTEDFSLSGGKNTEYWTQTEWITLPNRDGSDLSTKVKILYSDTGIYFLFDCEDNVLSASFTSDFEELWHEDVVEVFLWPDESEPVYFEYELSPLNYELPILVSNNNGEQSHWIPFDYSYKEGRKTRHMTSVEGGSKKSGASISNWKAEFFIPFELLRPMENIFPKSGTKWRANLYRVDYDNGQSSWTWQPVTENFHQYENFGTLIFE